MDKESLNHSWKKLPHPVRWIVVATIGGILILIGIFFLVFPGPGIPFIIAGLAVLASEFAWAQIMLNRIKDKSSALANRAKNSIKKRNGNSNS